MKIVFKINLAALVIATTLLVATPAHAQAVYFSTRELLADFFRTSQNVTYKKIDLVAEAQARIGRRLGYPLPRSSYTFFVATSNGKIDGYALIDDEKGEHLPITFAVKLSPDGKVERQDATISSRAMATGVRRALVLFDELVKPMQIVTARR
jgi:hypothetical protein